MSAAIPTHFLAARASASLGAPSVDSLIYQDQIQGDQSKESSQVVVLNKVVGLNP